jgi:hypothetical protein
MEVSKYRDSMLENVGSLVTIVVASCCMCSILFKSKTVQPSQSSHTYFDIGLISKIYVYEIFPVKFDFEFT